MYYYCTVMIHSAGKYDVANRDYVPTDNSPLRMILDAWQIRVVGHSRTCLVVPSAYIRYCVGIVYNVDEHIG